MPLQGVPPLLPFTVTNPRARHPCNTLPHTDGSRRAFYKEFRRVVEASDVVIQVGTWQRTRWQHKRWKHVICKHKRRSKHER